ncbi:MAG: hypothetical protein AAF502_21705 [Bacteroidota bacterium]
MKKVLKWIGIALLLIIVILVILGLIAHEKRPVANPSSEADALAEEMMQAVNKAAWDTTHVLMWDFAGLHQFLWDKKRHLAKVSWGEKEVFVNPVTKEGVAFDRGQKVAGEIRDKLVVKAWQYFLNDAFWLNPVVKAFDPGTERSIVTTKDGREGLMVHYSSGGVTPGDSYVWILDENKRPEAWKMWVKIVPIGGVESTWENWITLETGALVSTLHGSPIFDLELTNVKGATDFESLGIEGDPFAIMFE